MFNTLYRLLCKVWYGKKYYLKLEQDIERIFSKLTRRVDFELWTGVFFLFYEEKCIVGCRFDKRISCNEEAIFELLQNKKMYVKDKIYCKILEDVVLRICTTTVYFNLNTLGMVLETRTNNTSFPAIISWHMINRHFNNFKYLKKLLPPEPIYIPATT